METKALKIPCQLEGFSYRKASGDWAITFIVQKSQLGFAQPLQFEIDSNFVIACIKVKSLEEVSELMGKEIINHVES